LEQAFPGQVFLDVSGIDAGDDFAEKLKSAVAASKALVAVIGPGWLVSRDGARKLGEEGDFVTEEIAAAIESGITIVPELVDGARMPAIDELPPRLRELSRRNAVSISHERFDSDSKHLVEALYKPLGIEPPNRIEKILELAGVGATYSQRTRDRLAVISILAACLGAFLTGAVGGREPQRPSGGIDAAPRVRAGAGLRYSGPQLAALATGRARCDCRIGFGCDRRPRPEFLPRDPDAIRSVDGIVASRAIAQPLAHVSRGPDRVVEPCAVYSTAAHGRLPLLLPRGQTRRHTAPSERRGGDVQKCLRRIRYLRGIAHGQCADGDFLSLVRRARS
jgi:hypothetical protein